MSEKVYKGKIVFRRISTIPWVEFKKDNRPESPDIFAPVVLADIELCKDAPGREVRFVLRDLPCPDFKSDYGYAQIII